MKKKSKTTIKFKKSFLGKVHFQKLSKNFIPIFLCMVFEKNFSNINHKFLNILNSEIEKNLFYIETFVEIEKDLMLTIFDFYNFFFERVNCDQKILKIWHANCFFPIFKKGDQVVFKKEKNEKKIRKIEKFENDFIYLSGCKNKYTFLKNSENQIKQYSNFKKKKRIDYNDSDNFLLKKLKIDRAVLLEPILILNDSEKSLNDSYKKKNGKNYLLQKENFFSKPFFLHEGMVFFFKNSLSINVITQIEKNLIKFLDFFDCVHEKNLNKIVKNIIILKTDERRGSDIVGNILFLGDIVLVVSGKYYGNYGIVKFIEKNRLFVSCSSIIENNGFVALSTQEVKSFLGKPSKKFFSDYNDFNNKFTIKKGIFKGYENKLVQEKNGRIDFEIPSTGKTVIISEKDFIAKQYL